MIHISAQISSSLRVIQPFPLSPVEFLSTVCRACRWENSPHRLTSLLILRQSSGGGGMGRHYFKLTAKTHWLLILLLLFFSAAIASRGECEHLNVSCCLGKDWVLFHFEKKQAHPSRGWFHLHERRCPCHFHFLWGSIFSVLQLLRKLQILVTFLIHCMGNFKIKTLRFLFIVKTNHQKTCIGDMKCKTPQQSYA